MVGPDTDPWSLPLTLQPLPCGHHNCAVIRMLHDAPRHQRAESNGGYCAGNGPISPCVSPAGAKLEVPELLANQGPNDPIFGTGNLDSG